MNGNVSLDTVLKDCVVGEQKEIRLLVAVKTNDEGNGFTADVVEVVDYEAEEPKDEYSDKSMKSHAPAVEIVISGKAKK